MRGSSRVVVAELLRACLMAGTQGATPYGTMPVMAGEDVHLHDAVQYWENVQAALAHATLLKACPEWGKGGLIWSGPLRE